VAPAAATAAATGAAAAVGPQRGAGLLCFGVQRALAGVDGVDQRADVVVAGQQQLDQRFVQRHGAVAHLVEHTFDDVCERDHAVQAEQAGRTLDGVRGTEDGVDALGRLGFVGHAQQRGFHVFQQFATFDDEGLQGFVEVHASVPKWAARSSVSKTSSTAGLWPVRRSSRCVARAEFFAAISSCTPALSISVTPVRSISRSPLSANAACSAPRSSAAR
jgi:hypothetical protein